MSGFCNKLPLAEFGEHEGAEFAGGVLDVHTLYRRAVGTPRTWGERERGGRSLEELHGLSYAAPWSL
ncbi:hypothetical protein AS029_05475 [Microbacterium enclense]|nr:hypothetical protein AS029_05475 [Microbacterium enclense]